MLFLVALIRCSSLSKVDRLGLYVWHRRRVQDDAFRPNHATHFFDGALITEVQLELSFLVTDVVQNVALMIL
jgi:hypothetical protein